MADKQYLILISGLELTQLKRQTWMMVEAFELDHRVMYYQGRKPIGFYRWDLDCLNDVLDMALDDSSQYPDQTSKEYKALFTLRTRIRRLTKKAYSEP